MGGESVPFFYIFIAFLCTIGATSLAIFHIYRHLLNYTEPTYQRYIVRIIFMVPVSYNFFLLYQSVITFVLLLLCYRILLVVCFKLMIILLGKNGIWGFIRFEFLNLMTFCHSWLCHCWALERFAGPYFYAILGLINLCKSFSVAAFCGDVFFVACFSRTCNLLQFHSRSVSFWIKLKI